MEYKSLNDCNTNNCENDNDNKPTVEKARSLEALCDSLEIKTEYKPKSRLNFYSFAQNRRRMDSDNRRQSRQIYSAGILPFYVKNNNTYLMLGKDHEGKWSDFGGRSEGQDRGRWDTTAAREFYEESVGSIMDIPTVLSRLQHNKNYLRIKGKTLNGSPYFMYFLKIPFKETYRDNFHSTSAFIQFNSFDKKYIEKTDIQWVSLDTLCISLDQENSDIINYPLRKVFKKTFVDSLANIKEFSSQFYEISLNITRKDRGFG
jgi:DNA-binding Xre family transcriptional regulator